MRHLAELKFIGTAAMVVVAVALNGSPMAIAQENSSNQKPKPAHASPSQSNDAGSDPGILAGPKVEPDATRQPNRPGRPNAGKGDSQREMDIPFPQWMTALRGVGLTAEQQGKIRPIAEEFQTAIKDFQQQHGEEMRDLQRQMREGRQNSQEPPKDLREKMRKLEEARPKPDSYKERIWALLTDDQQKQMKVKLESIRSQMVQHRDERNTERKTERKGDSPTGPEAGGPRTGNGEQGKGGKARPAPDATKSTETVGDPMMTDPAPSRPAPQADQPAKPKSSEARSGGRAAGPTPWDAMAKRRQDFLRSRQSLQRSDAHGGTERGPFQFETGDSLMDDYQIPPSPPSPPKPRPASTPPAPQ